jgi:cytidyltransferase-like protein
MDAKVEIGAINGRFQPFHHGHAEYLLAALGRCRRLIVGITNPHISALNGSGPDAHRDLDTSNPFTFFERLEMVRDFMLDMDISRDRFEIVPFPINEPALLDRYLPKSAVIYFTVYDDWGLEKISRLQELGYQTETLWKRPQSAKITSGTVIRQAMRDGAVWEHLVPGAVYRYIARNQLWRNVLTHPSSQSSR